MEVEGIRLEMKLPRIMGSVLLLPKKGSSDLALRGKEVVLHYERGVNGKFGGH